MSPVVPTSSQARVVVSNIQNQETVSQRCLLIHGRCIPGAGSRGNADAFVSISSFDQSGESNFPDQHWPVAAGYFKALAFLMPGANTLTFKFKGVAAEEPSKLTVNYVPLLQNPPLHLAIMVAKDSPLLIDCPPAKHVGVSSAHSDLDSAVAKFRLTAYMWQAFTAEDMRSKGLGRRTFRLDEEWISDTVSKHFQYSATEGMLWDGAMQSSAKVHIVPCDKTTAELRDMDLAQQNPNARFRDDIHRVFSDALKTYGGPFASSARPVVAGLILDSHYSPQKNMILAHAALGAHDSNGLSLGMFGSHLTYSWPRFIEEVTSVLLDEQAPGDTVGNDNNECGTMWEACAIGQGAFMHEVGHAFGSGHTSGIMARGYAQHWPRNFLARTAYCLAKQQGPVDTFLPESENNAVWDLQDALSYRMLPHFKLPSDPKAWIVMKTARPSVEVLDDDEDFTRVLIRASHGGIVRVRFNGKDKAVFSIEEAPNELTYTDAELEDATVPPRQKLSIEVLHANGKVKFVSDIWRLLANRSYVRIPGSDLRLLKRSITCDESGHKVNKDTWEWAAMLTKRGKDGALVRATSIDLRVGCILDGAYVYYSDNSRVNLGPIWSPRGQNHTFGGHASQKLSLPDGKQITKVEVNEKGWSCLCGFRMHLDDGHAAGELNCPASEASVLEPQVGHKIVGFFGTSNRSGFGEMLELGIITAPVDAEIPEPVHEMSELMNTDGGTGPRPEGFGDRDEDYSHNDEDDYE